MFPLLATLILVGSQVEMPLSPEQLRDLIRAKTAPLKSLVFVYEGQFRWPGGAASLDQDFQGTFLYRSDGTAYYDLYQIHPAQGAGVTRKKGSFSSSKGRVESAGYAMDSMQRVGPLEVTSLPGTLINLDSWESPIDLCAIWDFETVYDKFQRDVELEGWEDLSGRKCLRVRTSILVDGKDNDKERNKRLYWIDMDRNAQVLKMEYYKDGNLIVTTDDIRLAEYPLKDRTSYWLPVHARHRTFQADRKEAISERTFSIVAGSEQLNLDLPDSLFDVRRDSAYPTAKSSAGGAAQSGSGLGTLASQFRAQAPAPPYRTDPVSVRKRIEDGLVEADRQAKELEASSPARQAWSGTTVAQVAIGVVGLGLLGFIAVRKWRGG